MPKQNFLHLTFFFSIMDITKSLTAENSHENLVEKFNIFVVPIKTSPRDQDLCLEAITNTMETTLINHSERSSVPKRSQESCCKGRDSGRKPTTNCRESAMATVISLP